MGTENGRKTAEALLSTLGRALGGVPRDLPTEDEIPKLLAEAKRHSVAALLYPLFPMREDFSLAFGRAVRRAAAFREEWGHIRERFDAEGIDYLPLKGAVIRDYYPTPDAREFADYDVLIREGDRDAVRGVMLSLGYEESPGEVHDAYHKAPAFNFEMHRSLLPAGMPLSSLLNDVWKRAEPDPENGKFAYKMRAEDLYLHFIAHAYKHFSGSGTGVRTLADLFVLRRGLIKTGAFDADLAAREIEKAGLAAFADLLNRLSDAIFVTGEVSQCEELRTVLESGTYGTLSVFVNNSVKKRGRIGHILHRAFPPFGQMKLLYPALGKVPVLLPVFYVHRILRSLFSRRKRRRAMAELRRLSRTDV